MTTKQKILVTGSVLALIAGGAFLWWKYGRKKEEKPTGGDMGTIPGDMGTPTKETIVAPPIKDVVVPPPVKNTSALMPNNALVAKQRFVNVFSAPQATEGSRIGYIAKFESPKMNFVSYDGASKGFVKVNAVYYRKDGGSKTVGNVYVLNSQVQKA